MNVMNNKKTPFPEKGIKVLLQLSGGKDSIACMILMSQHHIEYEAIHFTHKYCYPLTTTMAEKACNILDTKLNIIDISHEIETNFLDAFNDRPCRYCKGIMDKITLEYAIKNNFSLICVGDNKDDKMLINRLIRKEGAMHYISNYFNQSVTLPSNISIYRPLLEYDSSETLQLVLSTFPWFKQINDTGDKYFEYSREGCPLQFKDYGVPYSKELMHNLKHLNMLCSRFASSKGIRASIHLPSEFIITIPQGYEEECKEYLLSQGIKLRNSSPKLPNTKLHLILIDLNLNDTISNISVLNNAFCRLLERLGIEEKIIFLDKIATTSNDILSINMILIDTRQLIILIKSEKKTWEQSFIENLCIEIFHTRNFKIINL